MASAGLLSERPQMPLNLMGPMSEEEQRVWQKGANSETSLRLYKKEIPPGGLSGPGIGRGAAGGGGERGRGRGRGFFDRHRSQIDDEDGVGRREEGGGRGFGRGEFQNMFQNVKFKKVPKIFKSDIIIKNCTISMLKIGNTKHFFQKFPLIII